MITFRTITKKNYEDVANLDPGKENLKYILPTWMSMLSAHYESNHLVMKAIYFKSKLIGFFLITSKIKPMYFECLIIDKKYQNQGLGGKCVKKILEYLNSNYRVDKIYASTSNPYAYKILKKYGFTKLKNKMADKFIQKNSQYLLVNYFI